ncbi:phospholipase D/nuclease [Hypoxylon crocopeplum]|nr:phospholipase D/nuclease [Hypoxylon crocopeplum]
MASDPSHIQYHSLSHFKDPWKASLIEGAPNLHDEFPDYHLSNPESLVATSFLHSFQLGTGASIFTQSLIPAIFEAKHEVILVTCFWASSPTLSALREALEKLAKERCERIHNARAASSGEDVLPSLKIRICFSSRSLFQKLFHTSSRDGYLYPPSMWATQLGLPSPEILDSGLIDLRVKSLFFLPFSVMHPKFLIIDRQRAWLPSCNVSWEAWLEGCVEITGDTVAGLVEFYRHVWDKQLASQLTTRVESNPGSVRLPSGGRLGLTSIQSPASRIVEFAGVATPTVLLPSSHHRNPRFDLIPWHNSPLPPPTPLNHAILRLLDMAESFIYMQTPNLTSAAVVDSLLEALKRGVNVSILTSKGLMLLEQIVTACTTTSLCLGSLIRKYRKLQAQRAQFDTSRGSEDSEPAIDVEVQQPPLGFLNVSYFRPDPSNRADGVVEEPVQSHLKLTIVDGQYTVLGSGNMDRASWFTSQELGVMFHSTDFATSIGSAVGSVLDGRRDLVFSSSSSYDQLTGKPSPGPEAG